ncbi:MAG: hypothetical protein ACTHJ7_00920 [Candidatus Nitrosocosmicus sp.]
MTIHCNPLIDTPNSFPIEGNATCTIVKSTITINCANATRDSTIDDLLEEKLALGDIEDELFDFSSHCR